MTIKRNTLIIEMDLPKYLYNDLRALEDGLNDPNCTYIDCLESEVQGSINCALADGQIDNHIATYLYKHFLKQDVFL